MLRLLSRVFEWCGNKQPHKYRLKVSISTDLRFQSLSGCHIAIAGNLSGRTEIKSWKSLKSSSHLECWFLNYQPNSRCLCKLPSELGAVHLWKKKNPFPSQMDTSMTRPTKYHEEFFETNYWQNSRQNLQKELGQDTGCISLQFIFKKTVGYHCSSSRTHSNIRAVQLEVR